MYSTPDAQVTLQEITEETLGPILRLEVADNQKHFVATNAVSIAQAHFSQNAWFRAIYADDTPVGFVMLYIDEEKPEYMVWRFMIDKNQQGKGYGYQALLKVIEHVRSLPKAKDLFLSYVPKEGNASPFYRQLGFEETGEMDQGENIMKLML
ncbi:MAG: GNAT family N-acetyltransferase [Anaerolineae bacterium]|nr:GNAT family N-acetyltransferase [Anaerolineae bacterium]